jgi:hypothetical protein
MHRFIMQNQSDEDYLELDYKDGHDETQLKAMSYVRLCSLLEDEDAPPNTASHMLLATEKRRRDSAQTTEPTKPDPTMHPRKPPIHQINVTTGPASRPERLRSLSLLRRASFRSGIC